MTEIMEGIEASNQKPPQISEMFQKFALAFKTKTFEFFADDGNESDVDPLSLLNSSEDFIPNQKVIILKPDNKTTSSSGSSFTKTTTSFSSSSSSSSSSSLNAQVAHTLISSIFATISSFEASYLQLQAAHVPFNEENMKSADEALVSHLRKLSDFKQFFKDLLKNPDVCGDLAIGSCLEAQVQENQSKLRILGTFSDRLQEEIDVKDNEALGLKSKLRDVERSNSRLARRLSGNLKLNSSSSCEVLLCVRVFETLLNDACRAVHKFTKILIELMRKAGWDLDLAANSVYFGVDYANIGHTKYAFLSYVCLGMFRGFDSKGFGLDDEIESGIQCNGHVSNSVNNNSSLKQLLEHVSSNAMELLSRNPSCEFSRFCEKKYNELIHPTMESSIFSNLDRNEVVLNSWRSLSIFYEVFVNMASSVWTLHKLALLFDPVVEIFQVESGVDFSMVYMKDIARNYTLPSKTRAKVRFTVVPGFKIGRTIIQSQVYVSGLKCTE